ncbi:hypothetical protein FQN55_000064 [Onygenales sp. PD_40]|nr:hypothetical protein FQN55_000064 [Onygenales sp. PD_40]KAK2788740.1 hypothetical protein FQN52_006496 [Onygenales sp. PD_12]
MLSSSSGPIDSSMIVTDAAWEMRGIQEEDRQVARRPGVCRDSPKPTPSAPQSPSASYRFMDNDDDNGCFSILLIDPPIQLKVTHRSTVDSDASCKIVE